MCFSTGNNNHCSCIWLILILVLVFCCCGSFGGSSCDCGHNSGNPCC